MKLSQGIALIKQLLGVGSRQQEGFRGGDTFYIITERNFRNTFARIIRRQSLREIAIHEIVYCAVGITGAAYDVYNLAQHRRLIDYILNLASFDIVLIADLTEALCPVLFRAREHLPAGLFRMVATGRFPVGGKRGEHCIVVFAVKAL